MPDSRNRSHSVESDTVLHGQDGGIRGLEYKKRGIAATLSALIVFGSLLSANLMVLSGFQQKLDLTARAFQGNAILSEAHLELAALSFSLLSDLQHKLEASIFTCSNALTGIASMVTSSISNTPIGNVILGVQGVGRYAHEGPEADNLTTLRPFTGFQPGYLNFEVVSSASAIGVDLEYAKTEHHFFHLPLLLDRSISLCHSALAYLVSRLNSLLRNHLGCSDKTLETSLEAADLVYGGPSADGLDVSFSASMIPGNDCGTIVYGIVILQSHVVGVDGTFTWRLSEAGSLSPSEHHQPAFVRP